ncbi:zinc finger protein 436-like [Pollicipes pollicipes]|uniref:zinc finger protein 436-like n=1 Tax=Pollicipes pollicipes TaxID=41117 RepID=UPI0018853597|nr:zinc finger protein 436-like [Pollicipes pollicipes]
MLSISRLKKHQLVHTDDRPFHCDKCPKSFKSVHVLNAHQLTHINYRPFKCDICLQTFAKKWTLRGHMSTHDRQDGADDLTCTDCRCSFQDRSTYESHVKIHTGERKWECKVCHRGFAKKLKLRKHMVVHSQAMLHKCHLCDREFRWKEKLVKHVMLHTGERPFKCCEPRCVKSFRAHSDLNVHIRNVHKKQPKKLDYPIVKSEPKPNHCELLLMRVNEMDGIPPCDLCTRTFASKDDYLNHIIPAHRDQEAYVCHPCKRVFDDKRVYDDHVEERHRRGEVMWRCQLCPKIFNKRSLFEGHKTLHTTKFQCKICFRFASDEKRLEVHIMNHRYTDIDNSSHACTICCRQFKLRFSLKNHMFKMHGIDLPSLRKPPMRKFECSICHARFVRPTPAYNHMVRVHNIRPEPEVQDMFDLTNLSVEHPELAALSPRQTLNYQSMDPDDPSALATLQNNIRIKVEAMAAQGMWDASEADGSTYLGGSAARAQRQQIIVIQQEGEEEIDLSRVLGNTTSADAQTLTMNADGVLVDDQGNPVSLMVEGGGAATHLLEYLRSSDPVTSRPN